ncbi:MAG: 50S ribosomal protein L10 [Planctomycetes bacterium]|nr:50S ribosomal protein L10 [Planctomycetota bacterium]
MPNIVNRAITAEYEELFTSELDALMVQPVGLSVAEANAFRGMLAESKLRMQVVKSTLAKRVLESRGFQLDESVFAGPSALILADGIEEGAAIAAARAVEAWRKKSGKDLPLVKGGVMDGQILGPSQAEGLSKLPTKAEVQSRLLGQILSPAAKLSSQLVSGGRKIAGAIKSHIEKLEDAG